MVSTSNCVRFFILSVCAHPSSNSDAKRPCCSTCARSHAYAVSHAVEGAVFPPHPECTYDEGVSSQSMTALLRQHSKLVPAFDPDAGNSVSRKMYEKMESKIRAYCTCDHYSRIALIAKPQTSLRPSCWRRTERYNPYNNIQTRESALQWSVRMSQAPRRR